MKPTIFDPSLIIAAASTLQNGTMSFNFGADAEQVIKNRRQWLLDLGISIDDATLLRILYGDDVSYDRIVDVAANDKQKGMYNLDETVVADGFFTQTPGHALFLPLADCGGIVIHDPVQKVLGLLHLGRHATFANLAKKAIEHMQRVYKTQPEHVKIWVSPSISGESYLLQHFEFADHPEWRPFAKKQANGWLVDLQAYNIAAFQKAGVKPENIEHADVDTATHADYPSHHRFATHGEAHKAGRFAVVAMLTEPE